MSKVHVKKGDTVIVISGRKDTKQKDGIMGKKGKILEVSPKEDKVIVEGVNFVTKHVKPKKQGEAGGILKVEGPLNASKVMVVCPKCGRPTRVGHTKIQDGNKMRSVRVCKNENCRETF